MNIDSLPLCELLERDASGQFTGNMHPTWRVFFQNNLYQFQKNLSDLSYVLPEQSDPTTITQIQSGISDGAMFYNSATNEMKVKINGTFKTVQVA